MSFTIEPSTLVTGQSEIVSSSWLLKETKGARLFDKFILNCLKFIYLGLRVFLRIVLGGKERRDRFYADRDINFRDFLYKSIEFLGLDNSLLLVFSVPKYNYRFCSLITRKIPNFLIEDMYVSMSSHEDYTIEHFSPREGDIFVDVGAAFGIYTILGSKRVGLRGKVVAIESQPNNFEMLTHNIKLNKLTNVIPLNYAVYSKETKLKLYSNYSVMPQRTEEKNKEKFVEVNADTLDNLLQQNGISEINWIKIDVEGAELEVLKELTMCYLKVKSLHFL